MNNRENIEYKEYNGKRNLIKSLLLVCIFCMIVFQPYDGSCIDPSYPEIGQKMPSFMLDSISNYAETKITNEDLNGQYYILDFWSSRCANCIESFPKVNALQSKYQNKLQIFLIGKPDNVIRKLYEKLRIKNNLNLANCFSADAVKLFVPAGFPHLIWVNSAGIVKAITTSQDLTDKNITNFLSEKAFAFDDFSYKGERNRSKTFNPKLPFLIDGNGGPDTSYIFRSVLAKWQKGMPVYFPEALQALTANSYSPGGYKILRAKLVELYNLAYFGQFDPREDSIYFYPILEIKDPKAFQINTTTWDGFYSYSINLPKERYNKENISKILKKDLECYFPYNAQVEKRMMPCYVLKVVDTSKTKNLRKKNIKSFSSSYIAKEYNNYNLSVLASLLAHDLPGRFRVFDETNINYVVNVKIEALMTDIDEVKSELNKYGLDLLQVKRPMNVLVISE